MESQVLPALREAAAERRAAGLNRVLTARAAHARGPLDLASNDYLGLAGDPRLAEAAAAAARDWGPGATGSRLVTGTTELHRRLEAELAAFAGAPRALVFSSGYLANLAVVTALAQVLGRSGAGDGDGVLIVSDAANHASLIDGCRLARANRARVAVTPHADVAAVERALAGRPERHALVVSDTVFSVAGDLAPVRDLHRVATAHGALLVLDEAHAFGVLGPGGRGAAAAAGIAADPNLVQTFTLSKALGSQGGAVVAAAEVTETLTDVGRAFIFDTGLAPPSAAAALAALAILRDEPGLGQRARDHARRLAEAARALGFETSEPAAAVVRVLLGEAAAAAAARDTCARQGVRVGCFRPPSVMPGEACLRLTARANLSEVHLALAFRALGSVRDHVRITA
ncbi:MAG: aminotransferase class I/II-fold pyridoxal phosphate-dependent enzyme [Actinobacteria bacterium]|nr:aminotransferase class I/II-fold pyridoxal phosphate-dependent enzyme [Actinomycetota bacterium]